MVGFQVPIRRRALRQRCATGRAAKRSRAGLRITRGPVGEEVGVWRPIGFVVSRTRELAAGARRALRLVLLQARSTSDWGPVEGLGCAVDGGGESVSWGSRAVRRGMQSGGCGGWAGVGRVRDAGVLSGLERVPVAALPAPSRPSRTSGKLRRSGASANRQTAAAPAATSKASWAAATGARSDSRGFSPGDSVRRRRALGRVSSRGSALRTGCRLGEAVKGMPRYATGSALT